MKKRSFFKIGILSFQFLLVILLFTGCSAIGGTTVYLYKRPETVSTEDAKKLLEEGNQRYVESKILGKDLREKKRKELSANGQKPFAVIVSCSDSRVPPELIFDQGLGDLFVIRDAGNVIDPVALGSVEYGAEHLNAPLVIVLGHENCGAVKATVDGGAASESVTSIINKIKPSYDKAKTATANKDELYEKTADENIKNSINAINQSPVIKKLHEEKKISVIGAKYHMETGKVTFEEVKE